MCESCCGPRWRCFAPAPRFERKRGSRVLTTTKETECKAIGRCDVCKRAPGTIQQSCSQVAYRPTPRPRYAAVRRVNRVPIGRQARPRAKAPASTAWACRSAWCWWGACWPAAVGGSPDVRAGADVGAYTDAMYTRKSWREKLDNPNLPKLVKIPANMRKRFGRGTTLPATLLDRGPRGVAADAMQTNDRGDAARLASWRRTTACSRTG